jgi:F0F1-type ATP synthase delta subunit
VATRLSRRKIAAFFADELLAGNAGVKAQLAAYLIETRRTRELPLIVRDIEAALADKGIVIADVASSASLSASSQKAIKAFIGDAYKDATVHLRMTEDKTLLGGAKIQLPGAEIDMTVRRKLAILRASKV